jgi:hypothetical protein
MAKIPPAKPRASQLRKLRPFAEAMIAVRSPVVNQEKTM